MGGRRENGDRKGTEREGRLSGQGWGGEGGRGEREKGQGQERGREGEQGTGKGTGGRGGRGGEGWSSSCLGSGSSHRDSSQEVRPSIGFSLLRRRCTVRSWHPQGTERHAARREGCVLTPLHRRRCASRVPEVVGAAGRTGALPGGHWGLPPLSAAGTASPCPPSAQDLSLCVDSPPGAEPPCVTCWTPVWRGRLACAPATFQRRGNSGHQGRPQSSQGRPPVRPLSSCLPALQDASCPRS